MRIYHFEHIAYSEIELLQWAEKACNSDLKWKKDVGEFIIQWFNDQDYITAPTSGSTGTPKEIKLRKDAMIASAERTNSFFELDYNRTALLCIPAKYIGGKMMIVRALISGMNLLLREPSSRPLREKFATAIDFCAMIPLQAESTLQYESLAFDKIKHIIIGGAPISSVLEAKLSKCENFVFGTFGMTETCSHVALSDITSLQKANRYEAMPGVRFTQNTENCLVIFAPHLFTQPLETRDIVEIVSETEFIWIGRKDSIINSGGIKISPEKVERDSAPLLSHWNYFITSLPDQKLGEKVILCIENETGNIPEKEDLIDQLTNFLPPYHAPKEIHVLQAFIRTDSGKIQRSATRSLLA